MNSTATEPLPANRGARRQFNLRTLFEITTAVCVVAPAFQGAAPATPQAMLIFGLVTLLVAVSQFASCRLFISRCPLSLAGGFYANLFCMSALDGLFFGVSSTATDMKAGFTLVRLLEMCLGGVVLSILVTCMFSLLLLIPALFAEAIVLNLFSRHKPWLDGLLLGGFTGLVALVFLGLIFRVPIWYAPQQTLLFLLFLLWAVYGGYLGGRLFEHRLDRCKSEK